MGHRHSPCGLSYHEERHFGEASRPENYNSSLGNVIPLMAGRIDGLVMDQGTNGKPSLSLKKTSLEYLKMFYVDSVEEMWKPPMDLAYDFYGSLHMLFGTDYPWGDALKIIENVKALDASEEEKNRILGKTAAKLFRL